MRTLIAAAAALALLAAACADDGGDSLVLYTTVTQDTVDAVVAVFEERSPGVEVEVFRAPTGEVTARIAAEQREGGLRADVLWLSDPLSMVAYEAQGLLEAWEPEGAAAVPPAFAASSWWGTRLLEMVVVHDPDLAPPAAWRDLAGFGDGRPVALPDPGFAGSALGALGFFLLDPGYGIAFYEDLAAAGAVQVASPGEVITGVAEGRFAAGMTLRTPAQQAIDDGSPLAIARPDPGAIGIASPIAVVAGDAGDAARDFVEAVLSEAGQAAIASTGWTPVTAVGTGGAVASLDWAAVAERRDELLAAYRGVFGG